MSEPLELHPTYDILPGKTITPAISFDGFLETGEEIVASPAPDFDEQTTSDLTVSNIAVGSTAKDIQDVSVASGRWISCKIVCAADPTFGIHKVVVTPTTDSTPAQAPGFILRINVKNPA